ncbi:MAG: ComF family protein, partial [Casimicrobiaceae bacterium]
MASLASFAHGWRTRLAGVAHSALPQACALCAIASGTSLVCADCARSLPPPGACCPACALPLVGGSRCGRCLAHPPVYDRSVAAFVYAFPLDELIQSYKYQGMLACADWFADAMFERRESHPAADVMVAMPLSRSRQRERGFNQSLEIAKPLARRLGIRLAAAAVTRERDTPPQASLPWRERTANVRGAFACHEDFSGRRVLVVDDVMTTGASVDELAHTLKRAGACHVENWLLART